MNPEDIYLSAQTALAELALSGCTTSSDHLYLFPNGSKLDDEIEGLLRRVCACTLHAVP
jgi:cytosine/adenosine deaminase-related metal-dependent hydrolase